ncbi:TraR/DksA C4-type zinc finger protein [Bacillus sp. Au-Bac7]|uniref:TraR/DksA C4-type zinc finger protein n=1 Tax=Bacillus sp. Au-Bac7 TaxID=2906458 RepID=UPI001E63FFEE|nr:TraR/DksA C4-type zinc finger protein [Bacillus sp. Au-Bac7]MCE4051248.1 TraR/DksA C4-type zinc finger protein [Bacillus sp. Au-Bac7]
MLTKEQLATLQKQLEDRKEQLTNRLDGKEEETMQDSVGELSTYDNHPADMGTELFERGRDLALEEHDQAELDNINSALKAIQDGTYGICEVSGKEIPYERLEAMPTATTLIEYSDRELNMDRPVEEDILEPAHGNVFRHSDTAEIRDYQDSFQEVARYGTSETPADLKGDYEDYDSLYSDNEQNGGFPEDYESFTASNITAQKREVYRSDEEKEYEDTLNDAGTDAPFGDVPYKNRDSYTDDKN